MKKEKKIQESYVPRHLKKETVIVEEVQKPIGHSGMKRLLFIPLIVLSVFVVLTHFVKESFISDDQNSEDNLDPMPAEYRNVWLENKSINPDYVGQIIFDSGLIDLPFVQTKDVYDENGNTYVFYTAEGDLVTNVDEYTGNDVYIWKNWKTGAYDRYEEGGSIFMDYRNSVDDWNLIIYGHHFARDFDPSGLKQFTPLDLLLKEENYEKNSLLKLILDNEIRTYEIYAVVILDARNEEQLELVKTDLDYDLEFQDYVDLIAELSLYDTGKQIQENDNLLTLITCIEHQPELRQAVICRELSRKEYSD